MTQPRPRRIRITNAGSGEAGPIKVVLLNDDDSPAMNFMKEAFDRQETLADVVSVEIPQVFPGQPMLAKIGVWAEIDVELDPDLVQTEDRCRMCGHLLPAGESDEQT